MTALVGTVLGFGVYAAAQQFDTGGNAAGYLLDSVLLDVRSVEANTDPVGQHIHDVG